MSTNYNHLQKIILFPSVAGTRVTVDYSYGGTTVDTLYTNFGSFDFTGDIFLPLPEYALEYVSTGISVESISVLGSGSWAPIVTNGVVVRPWAVTEAEPTDSWIRQAWTALGSGEVAIDDTIYLIYTVPEAKYGTLVANPSTLFPANGRMRRVTEIARALGPKSISYDGKADVLEKITINGTVVFNGTFDGSVEDTYISAFTPDRKRIDVKRSIGPNDKIELQYLALADRHVYTGFRNQNDVWYAFDANPETGHFISNPETNTTIPSSEALLDQVTLYLVPTAFATVKVVEPVPTQEGYAGTVTIKYYSAFNYGETHFVRHKVGGVTNEEIISRATGGSVNTFGHAVFGVNFYDENTAFIGDVFDPKRPSDMPLGRVVLTAPAASNSVAIADIRRRGGGVPEDFPMSAVLAETDGLDRLRTHYDMGIWCGKAIKEGGVVEITVDQTLLDTYDHSEIEEIVKANMPPGVDFTISYIVF